MEINISSLPGNIQKFPTQETMYDPDKPTDWKPLPPVHLNEDEREKIAQEIDALVADKKTGTVFFGSDPEREGQYYIHAVGSMPRVFTEKMAKESEAPQKEMKKILDKARKGKDLTFIDTRYCRITTTSKSLYNQQNFLDPRIRFRTGLMESSFLCPQSITKYLTEETLDNVTGKRYNW